MSDEWDNWNESERQQWLMFDAVFYGPTPPWEYGLIMGEFGRWEFEWRPPEYYDYDREHYMDW